MFYFLQRAKFDISKFHNYEMENPVIRSPPHFKTMLLNPETADMYFVWENGEKIPAHKNIVYSAAPYFKYCLVGMSHCVSNNLGLKCHYKQSRKI